MLTELTICLSSVMTGFISPLPCFIDSNLREGVLGADLKLDDVVSCIIEAPGGPGEVGSTNPFYR